MIALDTNVVLRLLVHDDATQLAAIEHFFRKQADESFFVPDVVLVETVWTLRSTFRWDRRQIASALRQLAAKPDVELGNRDHLAAALKALEDGGDFADALLVAQARENGCNRLASFDDELARRHPGYIIQPK